MNTQKYSLWDTLPELRRLHDVFGFGIASARKLRCAERIHDFETAAASPFDVDLHALAIDLAGRRTAWEGDLREPLMPSPQGFVDRVPEPGWSWYLIGFDFFILITVLIFAVYSLIFLALLPLWLVVHLLRRNRRNRCRRALSTRRCPDCDYDLSTSDAFPPDQMLSLHVGPRACTECGVPWPLLPPNRYPPASLWRRLRKPRSHAT